METFIVLVLLVILFFIWLTLTQRKLSALDENVRNAMGQIGIQISSRQDMTAALTEMARKYAVQERMQLSGRFQSQRKMITAMSTPEQVQKQDRLLEEILEKVRILGEKYPELQEERNYARCMEAAESYGKMVRTSCLIYNDSVAKLNRAVRKLPASLLAGMLGFHQEEYLELNEDEEERKQYGIIQ